MAGESCVLRWNIACLMYNLTNLFCIYLLVIFLLFVKCKKATATCCPLSLYPMQDWLNEYWKGIQLLWIITAWKEINWHFDNKGDLELNCFSSSYVFNDGVWCRIPFFHSVAACLCFLCLVSVIWKADTSDTIFNSFLHRYISWIIK